MNYEQHLPLVTVVTPSLNQGRFIEETILSVITQDYPNIEYLVIDGGSTDETLNIITRYKEQLTWISEPDRGQSHAINKGFQMAKGEILCWLNSDDFLEPGAISKAVDYLLQYPDVSMIYGLVNIIDERGMLMESTKVTRPFDLWSVVHWAQAIDQAATFFLKRAVEEVGYLNEDLHWCMDWDLWVRLGMRFRMANVNETFASIRMYPTAKTSTGGLKRMREIISVMRRYSHGSVGFGITRCGLGAFHMFLKYRLPSIYPFLRDSIYCLKRKSLNRFYENFHGVYADGWLGRKARFMFPIQVEASAIKFSISLPQDLSASQGSLTAVVNGKKSRKVTLPTVSTYEFTVPYDNKTPKPTEVQLTFTRFLPPDEQGRKRACKLEEVTFIA